MQQVGGPCLTEDTALCYVALKGLPGPYIKHFMQTIGHEGLNALLLAAIDQVVQVRILSKDVIRVGSIARAPDLPHAAP